MTCDGCKYWSELVAASEGCDPIKAMCLNPDSGHYQKMVRRGCEDKQEGRAIDDPSYRAGD